MFNKITHIQSAQNPAFKTWVKLAKQAKTRHLLQQTLLDGIHLIDAALKAQYPIETLILSDKALQSLEIGSLLNVCQAPQIILEEKLFGMLTELTSFSDIMAVVALPKEMTIKQTGTILALEGIQDPGNVGTILRTAAAFGVTQVWLDAQCADIWAPKVLRAGMGAHFVLECITKADLGAALEAFKGQTYATRLSPESQALYVVDLSGDSALVFGSEGQGLSANLCQKVHHHVIIPMQIGIESLNVSTAVAICLYEHARQRSVIKVNKHE